MQQNNVVLKNLKMPRGACEGIFKRMYLQVINKRPFKESTLHDYVYIPPV